MWTWTWTQSSADLGIMKTIVLLSHCCLFILHTIRSPASLVTRSHLIFDLMSWLLISCSIWRWLMARRRRYVASVKHIFETQKAKISNSARKTNLNWFARSIWCWNNYIHSFIHSLKSTTRRSSVFNFQFFKASILISISIRQKKRKRKTLFFFGFLLLLLCNQNRTQ